MKGGKEKGAIFAKAKSSFPIEDESPLTAVQRQQCIMCPYTAKTIGELLMLSLERLSRQGRREVY